MDENDSIIMGILKENEAVEDTNRITLIASLKRFKTIHIYVLLKGTAVVSTQL